jgi:hypothetical protein
VVRRGWRTVLVATASLFAIAGGAQAASVAKLRFPDGGPGATPVKSYSISVTNSTGGGAQFQDLEVTKPINDNSAEYLQSTVNGEHLDSAELDLNPLPVVLCLTQVRLSAYRQDGSTKDAPDEEISLDYEDLSLVFGNPAAAALGDAAARGSC